MNEAEERTWADLPYDLLRSIQSQLFGRDIICFHAVCRPWQSLPPPIRSIDESGIRYPSLIYCRGNNSLCNVYNPVYNTSYVIDIPELIGARIRFSKDGWLLISQGLKQIFFFNPFTKAKIDLPELPNEYIFTRIAFLSQPTSFDCVVFGIEESLCGYETVIRFIRRGENFWRSYMVSRNQQFHPSHNSPIFHNGVFYCLGQYGNLGVFDPKEDDERGWSVFDKPNEPCASIRHSFLVECNGELFSVFVGHVGKWVNVYKLNHSMMAWQRVKSLGDQMIFVSHEACLSATAGSLGVPGMENKIYFPRFAGKNGVFYSFATGKYHSFGVGFTSEDFYNTKEQSHCAWIEPRLELNSDEELDWFDSNPTNFHGVLDM